MKNILIKLYSENTIDHESFIKLMMDYLESEHIKNYLEIKKISADDIMKVYLSYPEAIRSGMTNSIINNIAPYLNAKYGVNFLKDKDNKLIKVL